MEQKPNPELERLKKIQAELEASETMLSQPQGDDEDMSILRHMDMDEDDEDWSMIHIWVYLDRLLRLR